MKDNCVYREKIIRTFHTNKECKDYNGGPCKYSGLSMREILFQNDKYKHTIISNNPYCLLFGNDYKMEELYELPYDTVERLCHEFNLNFENTSEKILDNTKQIIKETPKEQLINILEGYELKSVGIPKDGRISLPPKINNLINEKHKKAKLYYDEELGDVFIHFNIDEINNIPDDFKKINNEFIEIKKKS